MSGVKRKSCWLNGVAFGALWSATLSLSPVMAQTDIDTEDDDAFVLETIVVTAQRRSENIQEVPVSLTGISGEALQRKQTYDNIELARSVPNFDIRNTGVPVSNIFIRGVGNNDFNQNANAAIGTYSDDVFIINGSAANVLIYDQDRIEVLRGPQGTLYGRNTTAGAVNYYSRRPGDTFGGYINATLGNYNMRRLEGAVDVPILDDVLHSRFAFVNIDREGFVDNLFDGSRHGRINTFGGRAMFNYTPNENLSALLKVHTRIAKQDPGVFEPRGLVNPDTGLIDPGAFERPDAPRLLPGFTDTDGYEEIDPDPYVQSFNLRGRQNIEDVGISLNVDYASGDYEFTSITGYLDHFLDNLYEIDGGPNQLVELFRRTRSKQFSQEFRLASPQENKFSWIAGLYFLNEDLDVPNSFDFFRTAGGATYLSQDYGEKTTTYAAFLHSTYDLSDDLTLTVGGRYTVDDVRFRQENTVLDATGIADPSPGPVLATLIPETRLEETFDEWSGRIALDYTASDDVLIYGSISRGFNSGGFSGGVLLPPDQPAGFDPEILISYEVGAKTQLFDNRVIFNASAFYYDYSNLQVFIFRPDESGNGFIQTTENAADAKVVGAEFELRAALSENFEFNASVGLLDTEYKNFIGGLGVDFSGNELTNAPSLDLSSDIAYYNTLESGAQVTVRVDVSHRSGRFFDPSNSIRLSDRSVGAFTPVGASLTYTSPDGKYTVRAWAKNLFDELELTDALDLSAAGIDLLAYGEPRTYGLTLQAAF